MDNPLVRRLERFTRLSEDDRSALDLVARRRLRRRSAREDIIREGDRPDCVNLILEGWACRYTMLADGRRQILSVLVPGDLCDLHVYILHRMDHSIGALTPVVYAEIDRQDFEQLTEGRPRITQAMWWHTLVTEAVQREWTTGIGQRTTIERLAHLLLELYARLESVGMATANSCELQLTQAEIAEALGMTSVHANRMLQRLRAMNLIELNQKRLLILNVEALKRVAGFNSQYLHLEREGAHLDANE